METHASIGEKPLKNRPHGQHGRAAVHCFVVNLAGMHLAARRATTLEQGDAESRPREIDAGGQSARAGPDNDGMPISHARPGFRRAGRVTTRW